MARVSAMKPCGVAQSSRRISMCIFTLLILGFPSIHSATTYLDAQDIKLIVDDTFLFNLVQVGQINTTVTLTAVVQHPDMVQLVPSSVTIPGSDSPDPNDTSNFEITAYGKHPGHSEVTFQASPEGYVNTDTIFLRVTVMISRHIEVISSIMGWIYFVAWSISFYPQIYINFRRKSVVGLNFDFVALNIMGFMMYSLFNCGLYFSTYVQTEYFLRHPRGHNPVQLNDVFFSMHATFATIVTITQCIIYERAEQRVSITARSILSVLSVIAVITAILSGAGVMQWLDCLYACSYIKLTITFIKYLPQAYMNYKRKSTVGWSIGNIFLDFTGGMLSILQMMLNAYNYDDWASFFGDFTKFGLGLFSLVFDIFFMLQHYVFYRERKDFVMVKSSDESDEGSGSEFCLVREWNAEGKNKYSIDGKA